MSYNLSHLRGIGNHTVGNVKDSSAHMESILNCKSEDLEDYYGLLGCDELSSVRLFCCGGVAYFCETFRLGYILLISQTCFSIFMLCIRVAYCFKNKQDLQTFNGLVVEMDLWKCCGTKYSTSGQTILRRVIAGFMIQI